MEASASLESQREAAGAAVDREALLAWFDRTRARSRALFELLSDEAYFARPIALRHPVVFYEGHLAAFAVNTILRKALGQDALDAQLDVLFARGIDPESEEQAAARTISRWPDREAVHAYASRADEAVRDAIRTADLDLAGTTGVTPLNAFHTVIEHELMHQETLLYIWHRLPFDQKQRTLPVTAAAPASVPVTNTGQRVRIPAGLATLGADPDAQPFAWDNEFEQHQVQVASFEIDVFDVTNADYLEFVKAGGYAQRELWHAEAWEWLQAEGHRHPLFWESKQGEWYWRGQFELIPLPANAPVYVSHAEATAYSTWKGARLPTEAEFHRAAYGTPSGVERAFPWGDEPADATRGNFDFARWDPLPVGQFPRGASAWGVHDLVGNGWEWTSTVFAPFPGFAAMPSYPEYSADFFDGQHYVMKGASPVTGRELLRRSFRNWFRPQYPYVYATFRTVKD